MGKRKIPINIYLDGVPYRYSTGIRSKLLEAITYNRIAIRLFKSLTNAKIKISMNYVNGVYTIRCGEDVYNTERYPNSKIGKAKREWHRVIILRHIRDKHIRNASNIQKKE